MLYHCVTKPSQSVVGFQQLVRHAVFETHGNNTQAIKPVFKEAGCF